MKRGVFFWALVFIVGCAPPPAVQKKDIPDLREVAAPAVKPTEAAPPRLFEERELLLDGVALLNLPERPDPEKARPIFLSLIRRYPQSRWRPAAEAFIRLIDERAAFGEMSHEDRLLVNKTRIERSRALQENEQLKKAIRELAEKLQSETAALAQENEQLKRDIQQLKALEIELQKRERMLR